MGKANIITWNMQGAGQDPISQYCLMFNKAEMSGAQYGNTVFFVQECGSPDVLKAAAEQYSSDTFSMCIEGEGADEEHEWITFGIFYARSEEQVQLYDFHAVWRVNDRAKRCGTGIIVPKDTAAECKVLNSYISAEEGFAEELVADGLVVEEDEAAAIPEESVADESAVEDEEENAIVMQKKPPSPIVCVKADGVWFCTIHAIANRAAAKTDNGMYGDIENLSGRYFYLRRGF